MSISADGVAILFTHNSCSECEPSDIGRSVFHTVKNQYVYLGTVSIFEWLNGSSYRFKLVPTGCENYFLNHFNSDTRNGECEAKRDALGWVESNW